MSTENYPDDIKTFAEGRVLQYDPPSGWRYGFPRPYLPLPNEELSDTLRRDGYPESMIELAKTYTRFF